MIKSFSLPLLVNSKPDEQSVEDPTRFDKVLLNSPKEMFGLAGYIMHTKCL